MPTKAVTPTGKKASGKRAASPKRKTLTNKGTVKSTAEEDQARERVAARVDLCEQRPYLTGLSEGELDKILDFLQEAPLSLQQDFFLVISQYATSEERTTFLAILEELDDVSAVLTKTARLPQAALNQVHRLFSELGRSRFVELYSQEGQRTQDFMSMLSKIPTDLRTLLLRECQPLQFCVVTQLMDDVLTAPVMEKCRLCAMKRAKKFHTDQAFDYKTKFRRGCRLRVDEIKSDIWADPPADALLSFRPSSRETREGEGSFDVYFDNQKVDVFKTCLPCLRQVQRFVSEQGNAYEVYHTEGADQKRLLTANVQLAHEKARWWTEKGHKMLRVIGLIELFVRCRKLLKTIRQEEERLQRMEQREREAEVKREEERAKHEALVQRANMLDAKWLAQDRRAVQQLFRSKRMYCMLQEEQELGRTKNASSVRENPLSIKLRGFMEPEDIPVTAERASEVFGTLRPDIKDYRPDIRAWRDMATDYEQESNAYRTFREEMLKASEQKDLALRLERWRAGVKTIEERNTSRIMWERQEVRKRELIRHEKREKAKASFAEMEEEAARREQLAKEAHELARLAKEQELELEARELQSMINEERMQTRCDRFWGLDARAREIARLKKMWAKQRHDELKAKRKLMVHLKLVKEV